MSERIPKFLIMDMMECTVRIIEYTKNYSFNQFVKDTKTYDAVIRNIEVLGEAANRMPEEFVHGHGEIEWNKIIATRNRIIHGYDSIDDNIVWNVVVNEIPDLKLKLEKLLARI